MADVHRSELEASLPDLPRGLDELIPYFERFYAWSADRGENPIIDSPSDRESPDRERPTRCSRATCAGRTSCGSPRL
jgi:hypothetical protein